MLKRIINKVRKYEYKLDFLWAVVFITLNFIYFLANNLYKKGFNLSLALDKQIPFIPIFIIPYLYWYFYMIIGYAIISINSRKEFMRSLLGQFLGMLISYIIFFIFPTKIVRPIITDEGILNFIISIVYSCDRPFNCFPSLHVLGTYFVMRYTKKENNKYIYYYTQFVGMLVILSTVFIKQHFVIDIIAAIIIVELINIGVKKISNETLEKCLRIPYIVIEKVTEYLKSLVKRISKEKV